MNNIAIIYSGKGALDSARVYALRANAIDPGSVMVIENLARISFLSKEYKEAIGYATAALKINSSLKKSLFILIDSYSEIGNKEEADKYRKLVTTIPN
jgi:tetratricopeptide (TPR) repeat protein